MATHAEVQLAVKKHLNENFILPSVFAQKTGILLHQFNAFMNSNFHAVPIGSIMKIYKALDFENDECAEITSILSSIENEGRMDKLKKSMTTEADKRAIFARREVENRMRYDEFGFPI